MSDTNQRIADIVGANDVTLFMKGTPLFPQCGFSSRAVAPADQLVKRAANGAPKSRFWPPDWARAAISGP